MSKENRAFYYVDGIPTKGAWIDLDYVGDIDDVLAELAKEKLVPVDTEGDPVYGGDLLVADIEGDLVGAFYSSRIDCLDFPGFIACAEECNSNGIDHNPAAAFVDWMGEWSLSRFQDAYYGEAENETEFAEQYAEEAGMLKSIPENLRYYFDFERFGRDLFINDFYCFVSRICEAFPAQEVCQVHDITRFP